MRMETDSLPIPTLGAYAIVPTGELRLLYFPTFCSFYNIFQLYLTKKFVLKIKVFILGLDSLLRE